MWELHAEGETAAVHTFPVYDQSRSLYLTEAVPWRSAVEPAGVEWSSELGEWVPGGGIELSGTGLGEVSLEYCLSNDIPGSGSGSCRRSWEDVTVMVEPEGWQDARAWANDDAFRLLVDFVSLRVVLLQEVTGGTVTLDGRTYEIIEQICCLRDDDGASHWSLTLELPVMDNDTVRFFKTGPDPTNPSRAGHELIDRYGDPVAAASLTADDQAQCLGTRYCTYVRPSAFGGVGSGGFGLGVGPYFTSLELTVSAPTPSFTATTETRSFKYCLAHRAESCAASPARCAVALYVEPPRAPNAPLGARNRTGDVPSHHFAATDACSGADADVSLTIDLYTNAQPPPGNVTTIINPPPPAPAPSALRKCYDGATNKWRATDWSADPTKRDATAWCHLPVRVPAELHDGGWLRTLTNQEWRRVWHQYATGSDTNPDTGQYWQGDGHDESDWKAYWRSRVGASLQKYFNWDFLEGCQRTRPSDDWPSRGHEGLTVGSVDTRWQTAPFRGRYDYWGRGNWQNYSGDLLTVGHPLIEEDRAVCEGAEPRIVGVWGTHLGAANWIKGAGGGACTAEDDGSCTGSPGGTLTHRGVTQDQDLGASWHERLASVEPCIGEAECDVWAPPVPGWYQVRIEVVPPSVPLRALFGDVPARDTKVERDVCRDVGTPPVKQCNTVDVMWTPTAFVFDDLIWAEDLAVTSW